MNNNHIKNILLILAFVLAGIANCFAQDEAEVNYPKVGEPIIDYTFTDLENNPGKTFKISDHNGKWLVLDFWSAGCATCIASFPKMDKLAQKFKGRVDLLMVGVYSNKPDSYTTIKRIFHERKAISGLSFNVAWDVKAGDVYDLRGFPLILIVDPNGVVRAKTHFVDEQQLEELIDGGSPAFERAFSYHEKINYDKKIPLLTTGFLANGGKDTEFIFRSVLVPYTHKIPIMGQIPLTPQYSKVQKVTKSGVFELSFQCLSDLYRWAYFGESVITFTSRNFNTRNPKVILQLTDTSKFVTDDRTLKGYYAYSLILPPERATPKVIMESIQNDLYRIFGFTVTVEKRKVPVYKIVVVDKARANMLVTKGGKSSTNFAKKDDKFSGFELHNQPLIKMAGNLLFVKEDMALLDHTGLGNVDLTVNADLLSLKSVNEAIAEKGIRIERDLSELESIVIRDK